MDVQCKTRKERDMKYPDAPLYCGAPTCKGVPCKITPMYFSNNIWTCGRHRPGKLRKNSTKNTFRQRMGSIRYSVCMSIQSSNYLKSEEEEQTAGLLDTNQEFDRCVYCDVDLSSPGVERAVDHLFPLIEKCKPTIYKTESPLNKVQCCRKCNSSKGNKPVLEWMTDSGFSEMKVDEMRRRTALVPKWTKQEKQCIDLKYELCMNMCENLMMTWLEKPLNFNEDRDTLASELKDMMITVL